MTAATAQYRLRIHRASGAVQMHDLGEGPFTVGRSPRNDLVLDDTMASRAHARFERDGDTWSVRDLGAKNRTLVNGEPVEERELENGDEILIGDTRVVFLGPDHEPRPAPAPPPPPAPKPDALVPPPDPVPAFSLPEVGSPPPDAGVFAEFVATAKADLQVLDEAARRLLDLLSCGRATLVLVEEGTRKPVMQFTGAGPDAPELPPDPDAYIEALLAADDTGALDADHARNRFGAALGPDRHLLLVPLIGPQGVLGLLFAERLADRDPFDDSECARARVAAAQLAVFTRLLVR